MPNHCKFCNKEIPDNLQFCSKDCIEQYKQQNKDAPHLKKAYEQMDKENQQIDKENLTFLTQFDKGEGSSRRNHNIRVVKAMLEKGMTDEQIWKIASFYFQKKTIYDYIEIARLSMEN